MTHLPSAGLRARVALDKHGFHTSHSLGQNFLLDDKLLSRLLDEAGVGSDDNVLEIGPGAGVMTSLLSDRASKVVSVELDERLKPVLEDVLAPCDNVHVVYADFLKTDTVDLVKTCFGDEPYRVVANLPYYITSDILQKLATCKRPPESIAIMVQKEAADRILSDPGDKSWCALAAIVRCYGEATVLEEVPPDAFEPAPHVTSCFMTIEHRTLPDVHPADEALFLEVIRSAFAMRRKTLANNLKAAFKITQEQALNILNEAGVPEKVRGEVLELSELSRISDALGKLLNL